MGRQVVKNCRLTFFARVVAARGANRAWTSDSSLNI